MISQLVLYYRIFCSQNGKKHILFYTQDKMSMNSFGTNIKNMYLFRTPLVENDIRVSVQCFADSNESIDSETVSSFV